MNNSLLPIAERSLQEQQIPGARPHDGGRCNPMIQCHEATVVDDRERQQIDVGDLVWPSTRCQLTMPGVRSETLSGQNA